MNRSVSLIMMLIILLLLFSCKGGDTVTIHPLKKKPIHNPPAPIIEYSDKTIVGFGQVSWNQAHSKKQTTFLGYGFGTNINGQTNYGLKSQSGSAYQFPSIKEGSHE